MSGCSRIALAIGATWMLLAVALFVHAGTGAVTSFRLTRAGREGKARVVAYDAATEEGFPILVFIAPDNRQVRFTSTPGPQLGEEVRVLYDPSNPRTVKVDSFRALWASHMVEAAVAVVLGIIPGVVLIWAVRRHAKSPRHGMGDV